MTWLSMFLILGGTFFLIAAVVGILRFPDVYTRLHAGTKGVTAGALLVIGGVMIEHGTWTAAAKLVLTGVFLLMTNPVATHAIARASYRRGIVMPVVVMDDYRPFLQRRLDQDSKDMRKEEDQEK